jgi:hypothetical protein
MQMVEVEVQVALMAVMVDLRITVQLMYRVQVYMAAEVLLVIMLAQAAKVRYVLYGLDFIVLIQQQMWRTYK